ncbi:SH3 domain-containing protein [Roseomonas mucosa]|uniref:SH3 domain-containing protein n=1 Tax=Roseomonas mucosa TaxID=207340 RepID=UPI0028CEE4E1|nr:SH3 domain-containing protein [Roseomonas mucosa]MDT8275878.1 SH3 domain-containing protein [Roseomonas mucosa]MDT8355379.1 SH3 domain-containing protein [Roseomonas mucosa]
MFQQDARTRRGSDTAEPGAQAGQTAKRRFEALKVLATVDDIAGRLHLIPYPARANVEFLLLDIRTQLRADHPDPAKLRASLMAVQRLLSTSQAARERWAEQMADRPVPPDPAPATARPSGSRHGMGRMAGLLAVACLVAGGGMLLRPDGVEAIRAALSPAPARLPPALPLPEQPVPPGPLAARDPMAAPSEPWRSSNPPLPVPAVEPEVAGARPEARSLATEPAALAPAGIPDGPRAEPPDRVEPAPASAPRAPAAPARARIAMRQSGNLRTQPRNQSQVLRVLPRGTALSVFGESPGGWYQVGSDQPWGWVHGSLTDRPR